MTTAQSAAASEVRSRHSGGAGHMAGRRDGMAAELDDEEIVWWLRSTMATTWHGGRGVNGSDRIGFSSTISFTIFFSRIRIRSDNERLQIRVRIDIITDSKRKRNGFGTEINLVGSVCAMYIVNPYNRKQ